MQTRVIFRFKKGHFSFNRSSDRVPMENNEVRHGISEQDVITVSAHWIRNHFPVKTHHRTFARPRLRFEVIREKQISTPPCIPPLSLCESVNEDFVSSRLLAALVKRRKTTRRECGNHHFDKQMNRLSHHARSVCRLEKFVRWRSRLTSDPSIPSF